MDKASTVCEIKTIYIKFAKGTRQIFTENVSTLHWA